jgi:hypothetical protein
MRETDPTLPRVDTDPIKVWLPDFEASPFGPLMFKVNSSVDFNFVQGYFTAAFKQHFSSGLISMPPWTLSIHVTKPRLIT